MEKECKTCEWYLIGYDWPCSSCTNCDMWETPTGNHGSREWRKKAKKMMERIKKNS